MCTDGHASRHLLGGQTVGGHRRWNSGGRSKAQERIRHRRHRDMGRQSFRADACPRLAQWRGFRPGACDGADTLPNAASKTASARGKRFGIASTCAKRTAENGTAETGGAATAGKHPTTERRCARDTASSRTADPGVTGRRLTREISAPMARPALKRDDFFFESSSRSMLLSEHDLFRKTGTHFSGSCFSGASIPGRR